MQKVFLDTNIVIDFLGERECSISARLQRIVN